MSDMTETLKKIDMVRLEVTNIQQRIKCHY